MAVARSGGKVGGWSMFINGQESQVLKLRELAVLICVFNPGRMYKTLWDFLVSTMHQIFPYIFA